jgi:hypothetical protein
MPARYDCRNFGNEGQVVLVSSYRWQFAVSDIPITNCLLLQRSPLDKLLTANFLKFHHVCFRNVIVKSLAVF